MGLYAPLNASDDRTADVVLPSASAGGAQSSSEQSAIPHSPSNPALHHRRDRSVHSNKPHTTDTEDDDEGRGWEFDDEEGIELMPTGAGAAHKAGDDETDIEGEGRHVDEDEDVNSPAAMVRKVRASLALVRMRRTGAADVGAMRSHDDGPRLTRDGTRREWLTGSRF